MPNNNYNKDYKTIKRKLNDTRNYLNFHKTNLYNYSSDSSDEQLFNISPAINTINLPKTCNTYSNLENIIDNNHDSEDIHSTSDYNFSNSDSDFTSEEFINIPDISEICSSDMSDNDFQSELKSLFVQFNVSHNFITALLILLKNKGISNLPSTAKTFLKTNNFKSNNIQLKSNVEYYYFGVELMITKYFIKYFDNYLYDSNILHISINVDGLPLFKSSSKSMWPILFSMYLGSSEKFFFPVALTLGNKPKNLDFLQDTVNDLKYLISNNIMINNKLFIIKIDSIICDAPAKAFVKSIKQYNGYFGCDKCDQKGLRIQADSERGGRLTYPSIIFNNCTHLE